MKPSLNKQNLIFAILMLFCSLVMSQAQAASAQITSPLSGSTFTSTSVTFYWSNVNASEYFLYVGTTQGANDLYGKSLGTGRTATVVGLPSNGSRIYARIWSKFNNSWAYLDYSYTATKASVSLVDKMTLSSESPSDGTIFSGGTTFNKSWTLKNSGSTTWNSGYCLSPSGGTQLGSGRYCISGIVSPNATFTFTIPMKTPAAQSSEQSYKQDWQFTNTSGVKFGSPWVSIKVKPNALVDKMTLSSESPSDGTVFSGGTTFNKSWTLKNSGSTTWNSGYCLSPSGGTQLGSGRYCISGIVSPNATFTFTIPMKAPAAQSSEQSYRQDWQFTNTSGVKFGSPWVLIKVSAKAVVKDKIILLLHGMNSNPGTWKDFVPNVIYTGNRTGIPCQEINGGVMTKAAPNNQGTYCYAIRFGYYDKDGEKGVDDAKKWADDNGVPKAGDFTKFNDLGLEIYLAVQALVKNHGYPSILLIGHSRGGLAARAFLNNANSDMIRYVDGLITTGTPHQGSPLGQIYSWLNSHSRDGCYKGINSPCADDWDVVKQIRESSDKLDVRRPVISYLATGSSQMNDLNKGVLPSKLATGRIRYLNRPLGFLTRTPVRYTVFSKDRAGSDNLSRLGEQLSVDLTDLILGKKINADATQHLGDGIVPSASQDYQAAQKQSYGNREVLHTEEPSQTTDIANMICQLNFKGWISACP